MQQGVCILAILLAFGTTFGQTTDSTPPSVAPTSDEPNSRDFADAAPGEAWLTGDWGGARSKLEDEGVTLSLEYVSTVFANTNGGLNTSRAIEYTGNTHLTLTLDTGALDWWDSGEFFIYAEERHGSGISERHVGDLFTLNNDEERDFVQVSEYWWRQELNDEKMWFKIGKMDANADFLVVEYGLEFTNSAFAVIPMVPVPTFPDPALGVVIALEPTDTFYIMAGIFDQQSYGGTSGFDTAFHNRADTVTMLELAWMPEFKIGEQSYPGTYRVGGWHTSGDEDVFQNDLGGRLRPRTHRGNSGMYLAFDQLIFKENDAPGDSQGVGIFFQFGWAPPEYNELSQYYGVGLQWIGALPTRDDDILGLAMGHATLSDRIQSLEQRYDETVVELFYKAQLTPWLSIMPDLQYVVNPGGGGPDAPVVGMRTQISF